MKAVVAAFNQEKALVGAFSVITNLRMELFGALVNIFPSCPDVHLSDDDGGLAGAHHRGEVVSDGRSLLGLDTALEMEIQTLVLEGEQITTETVCYLTFNVDLECMTTVP